MSVVIECTFFTCIDDNKTSRYFIFTYLFHYFILKNVQFVGCVVCYTLLLKQTTVRLCKEACFSTPHTHTHTTYACQIFNVLSLLPEHTRIPFGLQSTAYTSSKCPGNVNLAFFKLRMLHTFTVPSLLAVTIKRLSADQQTWYTAATWPFKVATNFPVRPSHTFTFRSNEALAK